ncbi:MAG: hypothetical protein FWC50_04230 [Planctomycetaceae bacterium]|nr:hypothetical protein [Planctomycetaceae bacterium]
MTIEAIHQSREGYRAVEPLHDCRGSGFLCLIFSAMGSILKPVENSGSWRRQALQRRASARCRRLPPIPAAVSFHDFIKPET